MKVFFKILRSALWQKGKENLPEELSKREARKLLYLAEKQTVSGMVVDVLYGNSIKMPEEQFYEAMAYKMQVEQWNTQVNRTLKELVALMDSHKIKYVVVKGQIVASYYPKPSTRQAGDIDYYCDKENFEKLIKVLQAEWGIKAEVNNSDKHVDFTRNDVTLEGHFSLLSLYSKRTRLYWQKIVEEDKGESNTIDGNEVKTLSPTLHTLYVFMHLYHHLMELGVGLRQFCDLAVMLHYAKEKIDHETLRQHIETLGMEKAFRACGSVLVRNLGLEAQDFPYVLTDGDHKYGKKILDVVMYRGNMGHYNKRNGFSGWKHKVEAMGIKTAHFFKFMTLAPAYSVQWLLHEFGRKVLKRE